MSYIQYLTDFRGAWNYNDGLIVAIAAPSNNQFDKLYISANNEFSREKPVVGNRATITTVADQDYIVLPSDCLNNLNNRKVLQQLLLGLNPYNVKRPITQLNFGTYSGDLTSYGSSRYNEFARNLSMPLRPSASIPPALNIQTKRISGIDYPVLKLYDIPSSVQTYDFIYEGKHIIRNANSVLTVTDQPASGATLTIVNNLIDSTVLTFIPSGTPSATQILIGANKNATATNIYNALLNYSFLGSVSLNKISTYASDGYDFTVTSSTANITNSYIASENTLGDNYGDFLELTKVYVLEGLTSQQLLQDRSIRDAREEARNIRSLVLNRIRRRVV